MWHGKIYHLIGKDIFQLLKINIQYQKITLFIDFRKNKLTVSYLGLNFKHMVFEDNVEVSQRYKYYVFITSII